MASNKNKTSKKQRTPRVVSPEKYKEVNRTGGGKPQAQQITSDKRVMAICNRVQTGASEFLKLRNIEETTDIQYQIDFWSGKSDFEPSAELSDSKLQFAQEAFVYGCRLVPDSASAYIDNRLAVRGRNCSFFAPLMAKKEMESVTSKCAPKRSKSQVQMNRNRLAAVVAATTKSA